MTKYIRYQVPPSKEQREKHAETYPDYVSMTPVVFRENEREKAEEYARQIGSFVIDLFE